MLHISFKIAVKYWQLVELRAPKLAVRELINSRVSGAT